MRETPQTKSSGPRKEYTMTTKAETKMLPMNDPKMCWARVWCRETGIAGGQGGYEKACHLKQTGDHTCGFHKKKGLQMGLITEERPTTWGEDDNVCPNDKKEGADIKWKCSPPDYSLTHGDHKYKVRDETVGKDLLRDKMNKKMIAMEKSLTAMKEKLAKETEKREKAESITKQLIMAHYDLKSHFTHKRTEGEWVPAEATDDEVVKDFKELKHWIDVLHRQTDYDECCKIVRQSQTEKGYHGNLASQDFNELFWETFKNPGDLVKVPENYIPPDDVPEAVEVESDMRAMLFNIADNIVQDKCDNRDAAMKRIAVHCIAWERCEEAYMNLRNPDPELIPLLQKYHNDRKALKAAGAGKIKKRARPQK